MPPKALLVTKLWALTPTRASPLGGASGQRRGPGHGPGGPHGQASEAGYHGAAPTARRTHANQAEATDLASVITLANVLRAAFVEKGPIKGEQFRAAS